MTDTEAKPELTPAEDNPWYLLATLYGVPGEYDHELQRRNRIAWNRYYAHLWTAEDRERLKDVLTEEDFLPYSDKELSDLRGKFTNRSKNKSIENPPINLVALNSCIFDNKVNFSGYIFPICSFSKSKFLRSAKFDKCCFSDLVFFENSIFHSHVSLEKSYFLKHAYFNQGTFYEYTNFNESVFKSAIDFTNAEMKSNTNFRQCAFNLSPPYFHGAKLHEGTMWNRVTWPPRPKNRNEAESFTHAYERLKLEMDRLKKHEDELMFFAKELECRRVAAGTIKGLPIWAYGVICKYGQSYLWPTFWLLLLILVGASVLNRTLTWDFPHALGVSTANTLASLGLRKELVDAETLKQLSGWLAAFSGLQTLLGLILLFLIGLGLRNRFRMK